MTAAAYAPLIGNYFNRDDFVHLWQLANDDFGQFVLRMHGGHLYLTRNLAFALFHWLFGTRAAFYFAAVLLTHLLNVSLLFRVVRGLVGSWRIACLCAALWGIAPINEGALGWYSAYGHVLATTCLLWVLTRLVRCRAGTPVAASRVWAWALVSAVGGTCFGIGIGVAIVMPAIAGLLLPPSELRHRAVVAFSVAAMVLIGLYVADPRLYGALYDGTVSPMMNQPLASHTNVARFLAVLAGYGVSSLVLGVFDAPTTYPGPIGEVVIGGAALLTAVALARTRGRIWRPLLACLLLAAATYGMVAIGRAAFVNSANLAFMVRTARYHYLGPLVVAVTIGIVLDGLGLGRWLPDPVKTGALLAWAITAMVVVALYRQPIDHFDTARDETARALGTVEAAIAASPAGTDVYVPNQPFASVGFVLYGNMAAFPGWAAVFAAFHRDDVVDGHRVFFVIDDPKTLAAARHGHRAESLLRSPTDAGR
jgi:hypothetical protein